MSTVAKLLARLELDLSGFNKGLSSAKNSLSGLGSSMTSFGGGINNVVKNVGQSFTQVGGAITRGVTLPVLGAIAGMGALSLAAIKVGTDFDREMKNIQSISKQTDGEIAELGQGFIQMSSDLSQTTDSATGLANAFYFIQSAGFAANDAQTILGVSTKAASAGLTDTNVAAKAILATLSAYGQKATDAAHVSDVLFKTVDLGVITFEELSSQVGDVVNTAATLNVPIEEVGGAIAAMTRKGISGAESVTALNQLMLQFISPSKKMADAAEALGVDLSLEAIRTKGLQKALMDIEEIGGPNAMLELFGDNVRALKGALSLTGENAEGFNNIMGQMGDVAGRTDEAFKIQTESLAAYGKNIKNVITNLGIGFATSIKPSLLKFGKVISTFVTKNSGKFQTIFNKVSQSVKFVLDWMGKQLLKQGPKIIEFFDKLATGLPTVIDNIGRFFNDKIKPFFDKFFSFLEKGNATDIAGWVTNILGLAALGPILTTLGSLFPLVTPLFLALASGITTNKAEIMAFFDRLGTQLPQILTKLKEIGTVVGPSMQKLFDAFINADPEVIANVVKAIGAIVVLGPPLVIVGTAVSGISTAFGILNTVLAPFIGWIVATAIPAIIAFTVANAAWIIPMLIIIGVVYLLYLAFKNNFGGITTTITNLGGIVTIVFGNILAKIGEAIVKLAEFGAKIFGLKLPSWFTKGGLNTLNMPSPSYSNNSGGGGNTSNKNVTINVTNPKKETAEDSITKALNKLNYLRTSD